MATDLTNELLSALGDDGFFSLVEAHAGVRLYIPGDPDRSELPSTIGVDAAYRLAKAYPGGYIRVPLAREFRARRYVAEGLSNRDIAKRLGLTESGIERLLKRARKRGALKPRRKKDPRQIDMFPLPDDEEN
ncbi:CRP-like cAMP-binding protein [Agrobacterium larrymoorei]|uniref:CRP-like cAMP-binding protein n=1 Tax=Agrobacterium larrymoorei TaxID=160699 RepID=A0AAJ2ETQ0_9HYPH|nr:sigma factor-like helix-turn-helix DNA-binding protein [Agrobacterium larrymoorei]MDR6102773.1 CRP-like cAMP-binding protein [Agrobacterium larrymoorei]